MADTRTLDEILQQAFTDGASDTMWQNDRHVEIFATAKKELEALIANERREAKIEELENMSLEVIESCEPECAPERHAYHEGTWSAHLKIADRLAQLQPTEEEK